MTSPRVTPDLDTVWRIILSFSTSSTTLPNPFVPGLILSSPIRKSVWPVLGSRDLRGKPFFYPRRWPYPLVPLNAIAVPSLWSAFSRSSSTPLFLSRPGILIAGGWTGSGDPNQLLPALLPKSRLFPFPYGLARQPLPLYRSQMWFLPLFQLILCESPF